MNIALALTNLSKMFDMSGKLFWKQRLREVAENGVFKISVKSLKNICKGVPRLVKFQVKSWKFVTLQCKNTTNLYLKYLALVFKNKTFFIVYIFFKVL